MSSPNINQQCVCGAVACGKRDFSLENLWINITGGNTIHRALRTYYGGLVSSACFRSTHHRLRCCTLLTYLHNEQRIKLHLFFCRCDHLGLHRPTIGSVRSVVVGTGKWTMLSYIFLLLSNKPTFHLTRSCVLVVMSRDEKNVSKRRRNESGREEETDVAGQSVKRSDGKQIDTKPAQHREKWDCDG